MSSCSSCSGASGASQQDVAIMLLQKKNQKSQGEAIQTLIEAAKVDVPNENGNISLLA